MKLDRKDRRLLYELDLDSRQSFNELGRKAGLSKDSVIYRVNRLKKAGVIKQFHTVVNVGKLGFLSFRLYLKFQNTSPEMEEKIIDFLRRKKNVTWIVSVEGGYDLGMWVLVKNVGEMNEFWRELIGKYRMYIEERWLTIFTKVSYFPRSYLLEEKKTRKEFIFITNPKEVKVDSVDLKLLELLAPNSRISVLDLAGKLKVTVKTVSSRIKSLEKKGIIVGYRTVFDLEKLGRQYFKLHFNFYDLDKEKEKGVRDYLRKSLVVVYDNEVLGGDDIEVEVQVESIQELRDFLDDFKKRFSGILKNYRYFLFYKEHKYVFFPSI